MCPNTPTSQTACSGADSSCGNPQTLVLRSSLDTDSNVTLPEKSYSGDLLANSHRPPMHAVTVGLRVFKLLVPPLFTQRRASTPDVELLMRDGENPI
jgi:hypothetical protein